jgi:6-phosphogluconolactonase
MTTNREILPDPESLARRAAEIVAERLAAATGPVAVALSGGSTPKRLFELLVEPPFRDLVPWDRVHWFWGDERFVPPDHPDSNYRMARLALLDRVPVPARNVHPVPTTGLTPDEAAERYAAELRAIYGSETLDPDRPLFDIVLLGLGEDGHTASLFPGVPALAERTRWTAAVIGAKPEPRITLTYPALESAGIILFLVAGAAKHAVLDRIAAGADLPAAHVRPQGELRWLLDRAAAGEI